MQPYQILIFLTRIFQGYFLRFRKTNLEEHLGMIASVILTICKWVELFPVVFRVIFEKLSVFNQCLIFAFMTYIEQHL